MLSFDWTLPSDGSWLCHVSAHGWRAVFFVVCLPLLGQLGSFFFFFFVFWVDIFVGDF